MNNFSKIIVEENMDNNFLFKMKKKEENNKSIGYLFGLFEIHKEECYVTEYSIQQTSLEQIFNKFAENQGSQLKERMSTIVEPGDVENIAMDSLQRRKTIMYNKIVVTDDLIKNLWKISIDTKKWDSSTLRKIAKKDYVFLQIQVNLSANETICPVQYGQY